VSRYSTSQPLQFAFVCEDFRLTWHRPPSRTTLLTPVGRLLNPFPIFTISKSFCIHFDFDRTVGLCVSISINQSYSKLGMISSLKNHRISIFIPLVKHMEELLWKHLSLGKNKIYTYIRNQKFETRQSEPDENINIIAEIFYGYFNFWWLLAQAGDALIWC